MATLEAVVSVRDNASTKFTTMRQNARLFEQQLEGVSRELDKIAVKLAAITSKRWTIHLDYDRNHMARALSGGGGGLNPNAAMLGVQLAASATPNPGGSGGAPVGVGTRALNAGRRGGNKDQSFFRGFGGLGSGGGGFRFITRNVLPMLWQAGSEVGGAFGDAIGQGLGNVISKGAMMTKLGSKLGPILGAVGSGIGGIAAAALLAVPAVTALTMGLTVLGTLLFSLAVPIAALIPALTALGGAFAFVGLPMFMMFSKTKQLVDQKEKLREELKQLTPGTEQYNKKLQELNKTQEELNKNGGEKVWTRATKLFEELKGAVFNDKNNKLFVDILDNILTALKPLIPIISKAVSDFATIFRDLFAELGMFMSSGEGKDFFNRLLGPDTQKLVATLGRGVAWLVRLFGELSIAIAPVADALFGKLNTWMEDLSGRLQSGESDLGGWLSDMMPVFTGAIGAIGQAIKDIANFFAEEPIKKFTMDFIGWFKKFIPQMISFFRDTMIRYGPMTIEILKFIGKSIALIWSVLTKVLEPFVPLITYLFKVLNIMIDITRFVHDQMQPYFDGIRKIWEWILVPLNTFWDVIQNGLEWMKGNTTFQDVLKPVYGLFQKIKSIMEWIANSPVFRFGKKIIGVFMDGFTGSGGNPEAAKALSQSLQAQRGTMNLPVPGNVGGTTINVAKMDVHGGGQNTPDVVARSVKHRAQNVPWAMPTPAGGAFPAFGTY